MKWRKKSDFQNEENSAAGAATSKKGSSSRLLSFLRDKPRVSNAIQRWVINTSPVESIAEVEEWHFRSLFIVEATMFNLSLLFFLLFFWVLNRQTHFRPTRGSVITRKSTFEISTDDMDSDSSVSEGEDDDMEEDDDEETKEIATRPRSKRYSYKRLVSYGIEQEDDEGDIIPSKKTTIDPTLPWSRQMQDLIRIRKTLWYLNEQAMVMCAKSAVYQTYNQGEEIFGPESFDGTLCMVIKGSVKVSFCDFPIPDDQIVDINDPEEESKLPYTVTVGPDKPLTSFLALFWGMVQHFHSSGRSEIYPFRVLAIAKSDDTELIRIPPECFAHILKEFPVDIFRIIGTVLNRLQRITVQTLVKTLGLREELLSVPRLALHPYEKELVASDLWKRFHLSLDKDSFCDEHELVNQAIALFRKRLGIPNEMDCESLNLLRDSAELVVLEGAQKTTLIESGSKHDSCYLLLDGKMEQGIYVPNGGLEEWAFCRHQFVYPGTLLGEHECFTGEVSLSTLRSASSCPTINCVLLKIPKYVYTTLIVRYPKAMAQALDTLLDQISPAVFLLNWTSEWLNVKAAGNVTKKNSICDSLYVVLNGRLRARKKGQLNEEYGRGRVVGEIGILTGDSWPFDVYAIRHSEIAKVPVETLMVIIRAFPKAGLNFARCIAAQVQANDLTRCRINTADKTLLQDHKQLNTMIEPSAPNIKSSIMPSYGFNLATIAVVPMDSRINLDKFCSTLVSGFSTIAPSKLLTKELMKQTIGLGGFPSQSSNHSNNSAMHELRMVRMVRTLILNSNSIFNLCH
jgi:CRP-like cAMP-binding protein